jgi:uncharacterized Zn finger protein
VELEPVQVEKRRIGESVWGRAWCENLERHGDFANRLPRGRTYLRQGAVGHVGIERGHVVGLVQGKDVYMQSIAIDPLSDAQVRVLTEACAGRVDAALDLVRGRLPAPVLEALRDPRQGLLPQPGQLRMACSCPDWARLCKHLAAVLYGVGLRLDTNPELLFVLRGVEPDLLLGAVPDLFSAPPPRPERRLEATELGALFDLEPEGEVHLPNHSAEKAQKAQKAEKAEKAEKAQKAQKAEKAQKAGKASRNPPGPAGPARARPQTSAPPEGPGDPDAPPSPPDAPLTLTRAALLELGVTPGQITAARKRGELLPTDKRGVYELTPDAWAWLEPLLE